MLSIQHFHDELYNTSEELKLEERVIQALVEKTKMAIHKYNSLKKQVQFYKKYFVINVKDIKKMLYNNNGEKCD